MNYDIKNGQFTDLACIFDNEGIISMTMDKNNEILYGLTWPSGILVSYDIKSNDLRYWGAVQGRGEWGHHPWEWDRICRTLTIDPNGCVYGTTMDGLIWKYDRGKVRRISYIEGGNLAEDRMSQVSMYRHIHQDLLHAAQIHSRLQLSYAVQTISHKHDYPLLYPNLLALCFDVAVIEPVRRRPMIVLQYVFHGSC